MWDKSSSDGGPPFFPVGLDVFPGKVSFHEHHDEDFRPELGATCARFVVDVVEALSP